MGKRIGSKIDLSKLPAPQVVKSYSSEEITAEMHAYYENLVKEQYPNYVLRKTDPAYKILQSAAYRASLIYQRVNDAVKECFLSHAEGSNLEQIGGLFDVGREGQTDEDLRERILLSYDRFSTAGSEGAYRYHALDAGTKLGLVDCRALRIEKKQGVVRVILLFKEDAESIEDLRSAIENHLKGPERKPLNEILEVKTASVKELKLAATVLISDEFDIEETKTQVLSSLKKFKANCYKLGKKVPLSGVYAALSIPRVVEVQLKDFKNVDTTNLEMAPNIVFTEDDIEVKRVSEVDNA